MQCDYFDAGVCRSCTLMGTPYAAQLAAKDARCRESLADVAPAVQWLAPFPSPEEGFRNKAKLVVGGRVGAVTVGILDRTGQGIDLRHCGLYAPALADLVPRLADLVDALGLEPYDVPARRGELKHLIVTTAPTGRGMLRFVLRSQKHLALLRSRIPVIREALPELDVVSVNLQPEHKAVLEGDTEVVLTQEDTLAMPVNDVTLHLRPDGFFQTNTAVAAGLYRQVRSWVGAVRPASLWDLYCGAGGFALHCAGHVPGVTDVVGVEVSPGAVASARRSLAELAGERPVGRVDFRVGDAATAGAEGEAPPELVVVNPPRRGIGSDLSAWLERSPVRHVAYSSCNVDSLARDLARMPGFTATEARLFDMFPQTDHHEVAVLLERR